MVKYIDDIMMSYKRGDCDQTQIPSGQWLPMRPLPMYSWRDRLKDAWAVFKGEADAYWWRSDK